jgi:hypothetical protein
MPTVHRRENTFIERFLSTYEGRSWCDATVDWMDTRVDGGVEALAIRREDAKSLAIEHTIVEPFLKDKEDFALFSKAFLRIEADTSLAVENLWIRLFVPVGTLHGKRRKADIDAVVEGVNRWLRVNRLRLKHGRSEHVCSLPNNAKITVAVQVVPLKGPGKLHVRRQQVDDNLEEVVRTALARKLPKLVNTVADKRLLLLERQHMNLIPQQILAAIDKLRSEFPSLVNVHEIWILETMNYDTSAYLRFEHWKGDKCAQSLEFLGSEPFLYD